MFLLYLMYRLEIGMKLVRCSEGSVEGLLVIEKDQKNDRNFVKEFTRRS